MGAAQDGVVVRSTAERWKGVVRAAVNAGAFALLGAVGCHWRHGHGKGESPCFILGWRDGLIKGQDGLR